MKIQFKTEYLTTLLFLSLFIATFILYFQDPPTPPMETKSADTFKQTCEYTTPYALDECICDGKMLYHHMIIETTKTCGDSENYLYFCYGTDAPPDAACPNGYHNIKQRVRVIFDTLKDPVNEEMIRSILTDLGVENIIQINPSATQFYAHVDVTIGMEDWFVETIKSKPGVIVARRDRVECESNTLYKPEK